MSNNKIRLYFNGEEKEPYKLVINPNSYFDINNNEFTLKSNYYYDFEGKPSTSLPARITFNNLKDIDVIKLDFNKKYNSDLLIPANVLPLLNYCQFLYRENGSDSTTTITLDITHDITDVILHRVTNVMTINFTNLLEHNGVTSVGESSWLQIVFNRVVSSTETEPYNYGLISFSIERLSSYIELDDSYLYNYSFIRTINSNNELPNYGLFTSDGSISLLDKDKYVQERIATNTIVNNVITEIVFNGKQIARLVGYNLNYPYNNKAYTFNFLDILDVFENISCENLAFYDGEPNHEITAYELYSKLIDETKQRFECYFEPLSTIEQSYLQNIFFYDAFIKCSNLKEMWQQFLTATMCSMFINENGLIELNAYNKANTNQVYEIGIDKQQQNVELNLVSKNALSKVSSEYYTYIDKYEQVLKSTISFYNTETSSFLSWVSQAINWDYENNGNYKNDDLNFEIADYIYYSRGGDERESFIIETEINVDNTFLGGLNNFVYTNDWFKYNQMTDSPTTLYSSSGTFNIAFCNNKQDYDNVQSGYVNILNTNEIGDNKRKIKIYYTFHRIDRTQSLVPETWQNTLNLDFTSQSIGVQTKTFGETKPYMNSLSLSSSTLITSNAKYKNINLIDYLLENTQFLYRNGRKTLKFTTNNFEFSNTSLNSNISGKKGEILKVGDLIKLIGVSDETFKITKISPSFEGQLNIDIDAIEYVEEKTFKETLGSPIIAINNKTISWSAIENANYYKLYVNSVQVGTTENTNFSISQYIDETNTNPYEFYVIASSNNTEQYEQSQPSNIITYNAAYTITVNIARGTWSGPSTIANGGSSTLTLAADQGYSLPDTITVNNASYTYDKSTGIVVLSNPTNNVIVTVICPEQPSGYMVSLNYFNDDGDWTTYYSLDNGSTWTAISGPGNLSNAATQIKFKAVCPYGGSPVYCNITSPTLGLNFSQSGMSAGSWETSNYVLSSNVGDIEIDEQAFSPVVTGYTLTLNHNVGLYFGGDDGSIKIKIGSAPSSEDDYDYLATGSGGQGTLYGDDKEWSTDVVINNVSTVYLWKDGIAGNVYYTVNNGSNTYFDNDGYTNAVAVTLSENTTLYFQVEIED